MDRSAVSRAWRNATSTPGLAPDVRKAASGFHISSHHAYGPLPASLLLRGLWRPLVRALVTVVREAQELTGLCRGRICCRVFAVRWRSQGAECGYHMRTCPSLACEGGAVQVGRPYLGPYD